MFPCTDCAEYFDDAISRQVHMVRKHANLLSSCEVCSKLFATLSEKVRHVRSTHRKLSNVNGMNNRTRKYYCKFCDVEFESFTELVDHSCSQSNWKRNAKAKSENIDKNEISSAYSSSGKGKGIKSDSEDKVLVRNADTFSSFEFLNYCEKQENQDQVADDTNPVSYIDCDEDESHSIREEKPELPEASACSEMMPKVESNESCDSNGSALDKRVENVEDRRASSEFQADNSKYLSSDLLHVSDANKYSSGSNYNVDNSTNSKYNVDNSINSEYHNSSPLSLKADSVDCDVDSALQNNSSISSNILHHKKGDSEFSDITNISSSVSHCKNDGSQLSDLDKETAVPADCSESGDNLSNCELGMDMELCEPGQSYHFSEGGESWTISRNLDNDDTEVNTDTSHTDITDPEVNLNEASCKDVITTSLVTDYPTVESVYSLRTDCDTDSDIPFSEDGVQLIAPATTADSLATDTGVAADGLNSTNSISMDLSSNESHHDTCATLSSCNTSDVCSETNTAISSKEISSNDRTTISLNEISNTNTAGPSKDTSSDSETVSSNEICESTSSVMSTNKAYLNANDSVTISGISTDVSIATSSNEMFCDSSGVMTANAIQTETNVVTSPYPSYTDTNIVTSSPFTSSIDTNIVTSSPFTSCTKTNVMTSSPFTSCTDTNVVTSSSFPSGIDTNIVISSSFSIATVMPKGLQTADSVDGMMKDQEYVNDFECCSVCYQVFTTSKLKQHLMECCGYSVQESNTAEMDGVDSSCEVCDLCNEKFESFLQLKYHIISAHAACSDASCVAAGSTQVTTGSTNMTVGSTQMTDGSTQVTDGSTQVIDGSTQITDGSTQVISCSTQMTTGSTQVFVGSTQVTDGSTQVIDGSTQITDGSTQVIDYSAQVTTGSTQVTADSTQVSDGAYVNESEFRHENISFIEGKDFIVKSEAFSTNEYMEADEFHSMNNFITDDEMVKIEHKSETETADTNIKEDKLSSNPLGFEDKSSKKRKYAEMKCTKGRLGGLKCDESMSDNSASVQDGATECRRYRTRQYTRKRKLNEVQSTKQKTFGNGKRHRRDSGVKSEDSKSQFDLNSEGLAIDSTESSSKTQFDVNSELAFNSTASFKKSQFDVNSSELAINSTETSNKSQFDVNSSEFATDATETSDDVSNPSLFEFSCAQCNSVFPSRLARQVHVVNQHGAPTVIPVPVNIVKSCPDLSFQWRQCCETFKDDQALSAHALDALGSSYKYYPCDVCDKVFAYPGLKRKHMALVHQIDCRGADQVIISFTMARYSSNNVISEEACVGDKVYVPSSLGSYPVSGIASSNDMNDPTSEDTASTSASEATLTNTDSASANADTTSEHAAATLSVPSTDGGTNIFQSGQNASSQMNPKSNISKPSDISTTEGNQTNTPPTYPCKFCNKQLATLMELATHAVKVHKIKKLVTKPNELFPCKFCGKTFSSPATLSKHALRNHQQDMPRPHYSCDCGKRFSSTAGLYIHQRKTCKLNRKPVDEKPARSQDGEVFECRFCDYWFVSEAHLKNHMRRSHPDNQPPSKDRPPSPDQRAELRRKALDLSSLPAIECSCGDRFYSVIQLERHQRKRTHAKKLRNNKDKIDEV